MNSISKVIIALTALISTVTAASTVWDGSANTDWYKANAQAYNIMTAEELAGLAKLVNEGTSDFSGKTITLGADVFLNDTAGAGAGTWASIARRAWTPIGTSSHPFRGEFDGLAGKKNRKVYGLYYNDSTKSYVGLFGYTDSVKISNLDLLVGRVTANDNVGALTGYALAGSVTNVHSEIKVTGKNHVGGLVGYYTGAISKSSVQENVVGQDSVGGLVGYTSGSITGTEKVNSYFAGSVAGRKYVGGLAGLSSSILQSYAKGPVAGTSDYVGGVVGYAIGTIDSSYHIGGNIEGARYVGGLAGYTKSIVSISYSEGNVTATGDYVGGLLGYTAAVVRTCNSIGNVTGKSNYVGGLVGYGSAVSKSKVEGAVVGSKNYVGGIIGYTINTLQSVTHVGGNVEGASYVGGLAGYSTSTVSASHSEGDVVATGNYVGGLIGMTYVSYSGTAAQTWNVARHCSSTGNVKGNNYVGGAIGLDSIYQSTSNSNTVSRNINSVDVEGKIEGKNFVGGVVGKVSKYSRYTAYLASVVDSCTHINGNVKGVDYVGGLFGYTYGSMKNSFSKGDVVGRVYVGGLVGYGGTISKSYVEGSITGDSSYVGGIVGSGSSLDSVYHIGGKISGLSYVGGLAGSSAVSGSYSRGDVTGTGSYVGGLTGNGNVNSSYYTDGNVLGSGSRVGGLTGAGSVINSYSEVTVSGFDYVGGLTGSGKIVNSHAKVSVVNGHKYVGGLTGYAADSVKGSYFEGEVTGTGNYVGGLSGYAGYVFNSHSEGNVVGQDSVGGVSGSSIKVRSSYAKASFVKGRNYIGGLTGNITDSVTTSYFEGDSVIGRGSYVGGLAGYTQSVVSTSHSKSHVKGDGNYVGGLIGLSRIRCSLSKAQTWNVIENSYSIGNVKGVNYVGGAIGLDSIYRSSSNTYAITRILKGVSAQGEVAGKLYVGGVVGKMNYGYANSSYSSNFALTIDSCSHTNGNVNGTDYVGGMAGYAGIIRNSFANAASVKGVNYVGGLSGYASGTIDVSYFEGDSVAGIFEVGGLVGYAASTVDSSYATANVKGDDNVGGLIGSAYANVSYSYALGNVDGDGEGAGAGHDNLGGLVGYQHIGSISKSMALGSVSGTTKLGGLVGRFDGTSISQSYANGNVTGHYYGDPADEVGNFQIGGLVGYAKGSLDETYSSGVVKGMDDEPIYTGCMVGYVNGSLSVKKTYYDKSKCGLGIDGGENSVSLTGTPDKTTAEMQTQSTFEDWDFVNTWKIVDGSYPFLQIYSNSLTNAVVTTQSLEGISYDGTAKTPLVTSVKLFGETLTYETEYTISYANNVNAGTASINVCGLKPYGGCKVILFEIAGIEVKPTIADIENVIYTGTAQTPEVKVYDGETLLAASNYVVEFKDNVNAGTATAIVKMKGNYSGSASKTFVIEKATPVISQNPKASDVVLGGTLASSELTGGIANVEGEFVWKTSSTKPAIENDGYAALFVPADTKNYTTSAEILVPVKVLDLVYVVVRHGETVLDSITLEKGLSYTLPKAPDSTGYDFAGFYKGAIAVGYTGDKVTISENTVIVTSYRAKMFVITFKKESTTLQSSEVAYGVIPTAPKVTLPPNTAQYTYNFIGWDKELVAVTGPATYRAIIDSVLNKYDVVFKNYEGTVLKDSSYVYGSTVAQIVKPATPIRTSTDQYTYTFKEWSPAIANVTEDAVYTAVFDSLINKYQVVFENEFDASQSVEMKLEYGVKPIYDGVPTRKASSEYTYTFKNWKPEIVAVTGDAVYTAVFDSTAKSSSSVAESSSSSEVVASSSSVAHSSSSDVKSSSSSAKSSSSSSQTVSSSSIVPSSSSVVRSSSSSKVVASSSSNARSSSSVAKSSSSSAKSSSSSSQKVSSSSMYVTAIVVSTIPQFSVQVDARNILISASRVGDAYVLFDMQGKVLKQGIVPTTSFNMAVTRSGNYLLQVGSRAQRVTIK